MFQFRKKKSDVKTTRDTVQIQQPSSGQHANGNASGFSFAEFVSSKKRVESLVEQLRKEGPRYLELVKWAKSELKSLGMNENFEFPAYSLEEESIESVQTKPVPVQKVRVQGTNASRKHKKIVALRSRSPPVTFRMIASQLKLPLSSVQSELARHFRSECQCYPKPQDNEAIPDSILPMYK